MKIHTKHFLVFIILFSEIFFLGCRKGPQDPLLSFQSRKTRLIGVWIADSYFVNWIDSLAENSWQFDTIINNFHGTLTCNQSKTFTIIFYRDGKYNTEYHISQDFKFKTDSAANDTSYNIGDTHYSNGKWQFEGGSDGYKKKELLKLSNEKGEEIFEIVQLKGNKIQLRHAPPYPVTLPTVINYLIIGGGYDEGL